MRIIKDKKSNDTQSELKLIVAQGEAILARLEIIDAKLEEERKKRMEYGRD